MDTALQVWPHECQEKGKDHLPWTDWQHFAWCSLGDHSMPQGHTAGSRSAWCPPGPFPPGCLPAGHPQHTQMPGTAPPPFQFILLHEGPVGSFGDVGRCYPKLPKNAVR